MQGIHLDAPLCDQSRGQMQIRWVITRLSGSRRERPVERSFRPLAWQEPR